MNVCQESCWMFWAKYKNLPQARAKAHRWVSLIFQFFDSTNLLSQLQNASFHSCECFNCFIVTITFLVVDEGLDQTSGQKLSHWTCTHNQSQQPAHLVETYSHNVVMDGSRRSTPLWQNLENGRVARLFSPQWRRLGLVNEITRTRR